MRSEGQIRHQLKQVVFRHLQKRLRDNFRQRTDTCVHNREFPLDEATGATVGLCGYFNPDGKPRNVLCDARVPGCSEMARGCPLWSAFQTKDQIKAEFNALIKTEDRGAIAAQYPDIAALLWVLDSSGVDLDEISDQDPPIESENQAPQGFWDRIRRLGGGS